MPPIVSNDYKEKKKAEILNSALECFAQKGFTTTTIDDIAAHSGISKGSIYNYFASKDDIYLELLNRATEKDKVNITNNFSKLRSSYRKISFLFDVFLTLDPFNSKRLGQNVVFFEFTFHCTRSEKLLELITDRGNFLVDLIKETLEKGQELGEINPNIDAEIYAHKFWLILDGVSLQTVYKDFPYYDVLSELKELYLEEIKHK